MKFRRQVADAEAKFARGLPPTTDIEADWIRIQWRKTQMAKAYKTQTENEKGFFRQVKHVKGTDIQASRLKIKGKQRALETPESSVLGWSFSAVSNNMSTTTSIVKFSPPQFRNSVSNPRKSSIMSRKPSNKTTATMSYIKRPSNA